MTFFSRCLHLQNGLLGVILFHCEINQWCGDAITLFGVQIEEFNKPAALLGVGPISEPMR